MGGNTSEWLNLTVRWLHVVVGVMWIGQTYLFSWLDRTMAPPAESTDEAVEGELWMVHSGGFYRVEKQKLVPERIPRPLHWFRWEAALTWISGFLLLWIVYYSGGALVTYGSEWSVGLATGIGIGVLVVGWLVYDLLWRSPLGRSQVSGAAICFVLVIALAWGLTEILSGRAVYIHVGALFGTIMAANVWLRILPAQKRLIAMAARGENPDPALATLAKQRSTHNTFMSVPLILLMISNHFPTASYGHKYNWLMLALFLLVGWVARKLMTVWG